MESILLRNTGGPCSADIHEYIRGGGYSALRKALEVKPADIIDEVKRSGLRGRGGAGFPTGMKWSFAVADPQTPKYLLCNADEGEPGTFKDRAILEKNPHLLIEGMVISAFAIGAARGYVYLRGEYPKIRDVLLTAIREAREKNYLGDNILGKSVGFHLHVHCGAGAYICGEETALIESLEGKRGQPRIKPPFPVNEGFSLKPTIVNNVETLANIPCIIEMGGDAYAKIGSPGCPGPKLYSVSGHVKRPGVYELPMGVTLREIIYTRCGGIAGDKKLKAVIPGGISTPVLTPDKIDCPMDFRGLSGVGSLLGSGAAIVLDETVDMVNVCLRITKFFEHESCGKCTPCREGVGWMRAILERIHAAAGRHDDIDLLLEVSNNILGKTFCPLGDSAAAVVQSYIRNFRHEFEEKRRNR
jgi:NADH-quinone oxidoreductase subunit F